MSDEERERRKEDTKEAVREWLDEIFAKFGKFCLQALGAIFVSLLLYAAVKLDGFKLGELLK